MKIAQAAVCRWALLATAGGAQTARTGGHLTWYLDRAILTTYLSIYRVRGMIGLPDDLSRQLLEVPATKAVAQLTMNRDPYFLHLLRIQAFSRMTTKALVGGHKINRRSCSFFSCTCQLLHSRRNRFWEASLNVRIGWGMKGPLSVKNRYFPSSDRYWIVQAWIV